MDFVWNLPFSSCDFNLYVENWQFFLLRNVQSTPIPFIELWEKSWRIFFYVFHCKNVLWLFGQPNILHSVFKLAITVYFLTFLNPLFLNVSRYPMISSWNNYKYWKIFNELYKNVIHSFYEFNYLIRTLL